MIVGIFIPIYYREEAVKNCLDSLLISDFGGINVFLCLGINGASKDFKNKYLRQYIKNNKLFGDIHVFDGDSNIGKPKMVNEMARKYNVSDYVVSMDSDMVCNDPKWLKKFLYAFDLYTGKREIGALCSNQTGNSVHFVKTLSDCIDFKIDDNLSISYTSKNEGVGGGVLVTKTNTWKAIGGYRAFNVYGSDDGHYGMDCLRWKKIFGMLNEVSFFHPFDDDKAYSEWKLKAAKNTLKDNVNGFYESRRESSGNRKVQ